MITQRISKNITYYCTIPAPRDVTPRPEKLSPNPPINSPTSLSLSVVPPPSSPTSLPVTSISHIEPPLSSRPDTSSPSPYTPLLSDPPSIILSPPSSPSDTPIVSSSPTSPTRPLLLLLPWLGARPAGIAKYRDLYLGCGMDVLTVESEVWHFLWPRWGLEYGAEVLEVLGDQRFTGRPLLVHAFSIGGYTFTQLLIHMAQEPEKFQELTQSMIGQIYDSMVAGSLEHMATGLGKTLFPRMECLVRSVALFFFWLFKHQTADFYSNGLQVFYNSPVTSPALFFFCENDQLCDPVAMEAAIDQWRKRGVAVETRKWKESVHAAHLRCHPKEYLSTLEKFVNSLAIAPLNAKM